MKNIFSYLLILSAFNATAQSNPPRTGQDIYKIDEAPKKVNYLPANILVVLNGKSIGILPANSTVDSLLKIEKIVSLYVLNVNHASGKYGSEGKYGALEINTPQNGTANTQTSLPALPGDTDTPTGKPDSEASFPGGGAGWRTYLEHNANGNIPVDNGAPAGLYKATVQFEVDKEGNLTGFRPVSKFGYGMEEELIRILLKGPKWIPGTQQGKPVKSYFSQTLVFVVEAYGFQISTGNNNEFELKAGVKNDVIIKVDNVNEKDVEVILSSGTILNTGGGKYEITVDVPSIIELTIMDKKNNQEVGKVTFTVI